jgi:alpha-D-xyloside xylohydrolase
MIRTLFFEYPQDQNAWFIENEFLFGEDILAAPIFEDGELSRNVYLPEGDRWRDYHTHECFEGGKWRRLQSGHHIIILVRDGAIIPVTEPGLSVEQTLLENCRLAVYRKDNTVLSGTVPDGRGGIARLFLPADQPSKEYTLSRDGRELIRRPGFDIRAGRPA